MTAFRLASAGARVQQLFEPSEGAARRATDVLEDDSSALPGQHGCDVNGNVLRIATGGAVEAVVSQRVAVRR